MANEPEPLDRNIEGTPPFSIEDQLNIFRTELDGPKKETKRIPGFLFRDERSRTFPISFEPEMSIPRDAKMLAPWHRESIEIAQRREQKVTQIDENLLAQHIGTYAQALRARQELLHGIKPTEILTMVRDVWGKGEIIEGELGATLQYYFVRVERETEGGGATTYHHKSISGGDWFETRTGVSSYTGRWGTAPMMVSNNISVTFGNAEFPNSASLDTHKVDKFFADEFKPPTYNGTYIPEVDLFKGIPKSIWRRPDNLGVRVTVPYAFLYGPYKILKAEYNLSYHESDEEIAVVGYLPDTSSRYLKTGTDKSPAEQWFEQSTSQKEIMSFLSQKLEAQRLAGHLPFQIEAVELAKIEELRKRGLFVESSK